MLRKCPDCGAEVGEGSYEWERDDDGITIRRKYKCPKCGRAFMAAGR